MNIVYTINGEGMGHASRSSVVIEYLRRNGHSVSIVAAGERPLAYLRERFGEVFAVTGLHMVYRENSVKRMRTVLQALLTATDIRKDIERVKRSLIAKPPDVVITDFDFHGGMLARLFKVPIISLDNIQTLTQAQLKVAADDMLDYDLNYLVAKMMVPHADFYLIASFVPLVPRHENTNVFFIPPPLRASVLASKPSQGKHLLIYQTADSSSQLLPLLAQSGEECIIYNCAARVEAHNLHYRPFSEPEFIHDLASAKGVITNGGFTVIAESLYYRKPVLSIPIRNFYEQKCNGLLLEKAGYGMMAERLTKTSLDAFLRQLDLFKLQTASITFDNYEVFTKLDEVLQKLPTIPR